MSTKPVVPHDQVLVDIVDYVYSDRQFTSEAYNRARLLFLDSFGCAIESSQHVAVKKIIGPYMPGTIVPDGARVPGTDIVEDPVKAAFDFGVLIRYTDRNDCLTGVEWGHPSDNIGAILPVMDQLARSSSSALRGTGTCPPLTMQTFLDAIIKAYEIEGCFQVANCFNAVNMDHTILVKVSSIAVISWLSGLSKAQALDALSQAWMDGHPLRTFRAYPNTTPRKGWQAGDACGRAVHLLQLTLRGQPGAPQPLSVTRWGFYDSYMKGKAFEFPVPFGETWIHRTVVKIFACEGHVLTAAEAATLMSQAMAAKGKSPERDIAKVVCRTQHPALLITDKKGPMTNQGDRDHCYQWIVAVCLLKGSLVAAEDYVDSSSWAQNPAVDELRAKMDMIEDAEFTKGYYDPAIKSIPNAIAVQLTDGTWMDEIEVQLPMGHAKAPLNVERTTEKYMKNLGAKFTPQEISRLEEALRADNMAIGDFVGMLVRIPPPQAKLA